MAAEKGEAVEKGDTFNMVEYLIGKGADLNIKDDNGVSKNERVLYPPSILIINKRDFISFEAVSFWRK